MRSLFCDNTKCVRRLNVVGEELFRRARNHRGADQQPVLRDRGGGGVYRRFDVGHASGHHQKPFPSHRHGKAQTEDRDTGGHVGGDHRARGAERLDNPQRADLFGRKDYRLRNRREDRRMNVRDDQTVGKADIRFSARFRRMTIFRCVLFRPFRRNGILRVRVAGIHRVIFPLLVEFVAFRTEPGTLERFGLRIEIAPEEGVPLSLATAAGSGFGLPDFSRDRF